MKSLLFILSVFFFTNVWAQDISNDPKASFGISTGTVVFTGNNFVAKTYGAKMPFKLDLNVNLVSHLGLGIDFSQWNGRVKTSEFVGNSAKGKFTNWGYYLHYYYRWKDKWLLDPKIGMGNFQVRNTLDNMLNTDKSERNYTSKGNSFFVSPEINYFINRNISVFAGMKYEYVHMHVNGASETNTSYHATPLFAFDIGLRLWK